MKYLPVIGLEVHAELSTVTKMFCGCRMVDATQSEPNSSVCPVCLGLPGVLPVVNKKAVELGLRAALALECTPLPYSIFARKNYFYPDLPKGYQISQYETPLAEHGKVLIKTSKGDRIIRIRRVHLEEDTGKLTHVTNKDESYTLVDLNRAGVPLLEIVTEPDMVSVEEAKVYGATLQQLLRYIHICSCDMEKGAIRFEANVSVMPVGSNQLGTRTEIKNLNSFRSLERSIAYEIERQIQVLESGGRVIQETVGWNETAGVTFSQRSKEEAHDYRYFPEPDLPPLVVEESWLETIKKGLPELPAQKSARFSLDYQLSPYDISILVSDRSVADYFEDVVKQGVSVKNAVNWITGQLFSDMNARSLGWDAIPVSAADLASLISRVEKGELNLQTAKTVFGEMFATGKNADQIISEKGLKQIHDNSAISLAIRSVLAENPKELESYLAGKETLSQWFFGQVMSKTRGQAAPAVVRVELEKQLNQLKTAKSSD
jgi:aspartyl-tRNA(Asn)/glutamyl-tRNA(Gln) amidotransferase subunit B